MVNFPPQTAPTTYSTYISERGVEFKETSYARTAAMVFRAPLPGCDAAQKPDINRLINQDFAGSALKCWANLSATPFH